MTTVQRTQTSAVSEVATASVEKKGNLNRRLRRGVLFGTLLFGSLVRATEAASADACGCQPAPDCAAACPNGGYPKGDGTQACECLPSAAPRAYSSTDGGPAANSLKWAGYSLRLSKNSSATQVLVLSGNNVDYALKSELTATVPDIVTAGNAGPSAAVTVSGSGSFKVPYFAVNSKGQVTSYASRTITYSSTATSTTSLSLRKTSAQTSGNQTNNAVQIVSTESQTQIPEEMPAYSNYTNMLPPPAYTNYGNYVNYGDYANYGDYDNGAAITEDVVVYANYMNYENNENLNRGNCCGDYDM